MQEYVTELLATVEDSAAMLLSIPEADAERHPAPGKWSPKEILGHLIDSAANNHQRFVRGQLAAGQAFAGYEQDAWVAAQRYQEAPWDELVALWRAYNRHLARVMAAVPEPARRTLHRLQSFRAPDAAPDEQEVTLDFVMRDYVDHLRHHLRQIAAITG